MTSIVLFSSGDARRYLAEMPSGDSIITLTPAAGAELGESGISTVTSDIMYSDCGHARTAARTSRAVERFQAAFRPPADIGLAGDLLLEHRISSLTIIGLRAWSSIGSKGPWLLPSMDGWRLTDDRYEAQMHVMSRVVESAALNRLVEAGAGLPPAHQSVLV